MPFLANASFGVEFGNIFVNTDREVTRGGIRFLSQPIEQWVEETLAARELEKQQQQNQEKYADVEFEDEIVLYDKTVIADVQVAPDGTVTLVDDKGNAYAAREQEIPKHIPKPLLIEDRNGSQWIVQQGKVEAVKGGGLVIGPEGKPLDKKALRKLDRMILAALKKYQRAITDYQAGRQPAVSPANKKGGPAVYDYGFAAELPDCLAGHKAQLNQIGTRLVGLVDSSSEAFAGFARQTAGRISEGENATQERVDAAVCQALVETDATGILYDLTRSTVFKSEAVADFDLTGQAATPKNHCGEYLMLRTYQTYPGPGASFTQVSLHAPENKKPASGLFETEAESYQYLILRELHSDELGCRNFAVGDEYYLDEKFFERRKQVRNFIVSDPPLVGSRADAETKKVWNEAKVRIIQSVLAGDGNQASGILQIQRAGGLLWNHNVAAELVLLLSGTADLWKSVLRSVASKTENLLLRKSAQVVEQNTVKNEKIFFYTVQNADDMARLKSGGSPWPTEPTRAHFGPGVYSWAAEAEAQSYLRLKLKLNSNVKLEIVKLEVDAAKLAEFKTFKVPLDDDLANAWLEKYSSLFGKGLPHEYQYIQRNVGIGATEHYFSSEVFHFFKIK